MADASYGPKVYHKQGGNELVISNGGTLTIEAGASIASNANTLQGAYGATPVVQPSATGELLGFTGNAATNANAVNFSANGNTGTKSYSLGDVVKALKLEGWLASS